MIKIDKNIVKTGKSRLLTDWASLQAQVLDPDALRREGFATLLESRSDIRRVLICQVGSMYFIEQLCKSVQTEYCCIPTNYRSTTAIQLKNRSVFQTAYDVYKLPFSDNAFDLVAIQNAFDLLDGNRVFSEMVRVLKPGGWLYNSMVYEPCCPWIPLVDEELDNRICQTMELYGMENYGQPSLRKGDSKAGRKLWHYANNHSLNVLQIASSDWILYPHPIYTEEEKFVLNLELNFYYESCQLASKGEHIIDPQSLTNWYDLRKWQISNNELVFILNQRSLLAEKPLNSTSSLLPCNTQI